MHDLVVRDLERARNRTLGLTDLDDPTLVTQHDPLMSPLVWDLAHVGQQEELWLLRAGDPARPGMLPPEVDALYDAFKHHPCHSMSGAGKAIDVRARQFLPLKRLNGGDSVFPRRR